MVRVGGRVGRGDGGGGGGGVVVVDNGGGGGGGVAVVGGGGGRGTLSHTVGPAVSFDLPYAVWALSRELRQKSPSVCLPFACACVHRVIFLDSTRISTVRGQF